MGTNILENERQIKASFSKVHYVDSSQCLWANKGLRVASGD